MKFKRITPLKYKVIENLKIIYLNELEVRQLQVDIKNEEIPAGIIITDEKGNFCTINKDGKFDKVPYGFSKSYELSRQLLN